MTYVLRAERSRNRVSRVVIGEWAREHTRCEPRDGPRESVGSISVKGREGVHPKGGARPQGGKLGGVL